MRLDKAGGGFTADGGQQSAFLQSTPQINRERHPLCFMMGGNSVGLIEGSIET
jgi:hypothetical protein